MNNEIKDNRVFCSKCPISKQCNVYKEDHGLFSEILIAKADECPLIKSCIDKKENQK